MILLARDSNLNILNLDPQSLVSWRWAGGGEAMDDVTPESIWRGRRELDGGRSKIKDQS